MNRFAKQLTIATFLSSLAFTANAQSLTPNLNRSPLPPSPAQGNTVELERLKDDRLSIDIEQLSGERNFISFGSKDLGEEFVSVGTALQVSQVGSANSVTINAREHTRDRGQLFNNQLKSTQVGNDNIHEIVAGDNTGKYVTSNRVFSTMQGNNNYSYDVVNGTANTLTTNVIGNNNEMQATVIEGAQSLTNDIWHNVKGDNNRIDTGIGSGRSSDYDLNNRLNVDVTGANNTIYTAVTGSNNFVTKTVYGSGNEDSSLIFGDNSNVDNRINGQNNRITGKLVGNGSSQNVNIIGNDNEVVSRTGFASKGGGAIRNYSDRTYLALTMFGDRNSAYTAQDGNYNSMNLVINGNDNTNNRYTQNGNTNYMQVGFHGNNNTNNSFTQNGDNKHLDVQHYGNGVSNLNIVQ